MNEAFGDTVNFDLMPEFATERVQLIPGSKPVYGLNALGGALAIDMKDGFSFPGTELELYAGSFGRTQGTAQYGTNDGTRAYYVGGTHFSEDGWRDASPSDASQLFSDFAYREHQLSAGVSITLVDSDLNGNGAAPVELLRENRESVYTFPDNTRNQLLFLQSRADYELSDTQSLQGTAYYRRLRRDTLNGDETDIDECEGTPSLLCGDDGDGPVIAGVNGSNVASDAVGEEPFGVFNRTDTETDGFGLSLQTTLDGTLKEIENTFIFGGAIDVGRTAFGNNTEIGTLTESRTVDPSGIYLAGDTFNTRLLAKNLYAGLYAMDVLALTGKLDLTVRKIQLRARQAGRSDGRHVERRSFIPPVESCRRLDLPLETRHVGICWLQ